MWTDHSSLTSTPTTLTQIWKKGSTNFEFSVSPMVQGLEIKNSRK